MVQQPLTVVKYAADSTEFRNILDEMEDSGYALASVISSRTGEYTITFILKEEFEDE